MVWSIFALDRGLMIHNREEKKYRGRDEKPKKAGKLAMVMMVRVTKAQGSEDQLLLNTFL